jgi:eukaryotic-like serine/threonine-protein kinase
MPSQGEPDLVAGRYRLIEPLGRGGMGRVWRARDEVLHREVAVKEIVLPADLTDVEQQELHLQTLREARAAARLNHPGVIRIHDVLRTGDQSWIVMEYVPARSLLQVMREDGPLPPRYAAQIGLSVLAALEVAHKNGVLHRDVKPSNVLISGDGRIVLTDFGLASTEEVDSDAMGDSVLGSPDYIAPERAHDGSSSARADLWSLGATLYAAVEGRTPFGRTSPLATLDALASESPAPMRRAGPLAPVLEGLLRKDPAARISVDEATRLLRRVVAGGVVGGGVAAGVAGGVSAASAADGTDGPVLDGPARGVAPVVAAPVVPVPGTVASGRATIPAAAHPAPAGPGTSPAASPVASSAASPVAGSVASLAAQPVAPAAISPVAEQPPQRFTRSAAVAVALLVVVAGIAVVVVTAANRPGHSSGHSTRPPAYPVGSGLAAPGIAAAPEMERPLTPAPTSSAAEEYRLPEGWIWHHDPAGFRIAAPASWAATRDDSTVYFREPGGARLLAVGLWNPASPNPVTAWTHEETTAARLPNYQRLRIEPVPAFFRSCADWEYTYDGDAGRLRTVSRGFTTDGGRSYVIVWRTSAFDWQLNLANFWLATASFRAD